MSYLEAQKKCDVVMRGGVTSGIVYPSAVCRLAQVYRFENIGGTSAGAIAAAATAAAEYARRKGESQGFEELSALPAFLASKPKGSKDTNLFLLFQPDRQFRNLYGLAAALLSKNPLQIITAAVRLSPFAWALPLASVAWLLFFATRSAPLGLNLVTFVIASIVFLAMVSFLLAAAILRKLFRLPASGYGFCSGRTVGDPSGPPGLTDWLSVYLNRLAGRSASSPPLTFGDLRSCGVRLRMITTCLTHGRPYGLPIDSNRFYFKEPEMRQYFPDSVVDWMMKHAGEMKDDPERVQTKGYTRLPNAADLPVVAARMSLSFPILFRAVPLYTVDYTLRQAKEGEPPPKEESGGALAQGALLEPERCWFLDGGICSNFPLHLFDGPLPRWPTFGINLQSTRKDRPDSVVWLPERNEEGFGEVWSRMPDLAGAGTLLSYLSTIVDTARNWMDNRQVGVPGYRDRVVQVRLDEASEGGLNLNMPPSLVDKVSKRGEMAADLLISHFHNPKPDVKLTWDNHRWIRLRSTFSLLEGVLLGIAENLDNPEDGDRSYRELLKRSSADPPDSYRLSGRQRNFFLAWIDGLASLVEDLHKTPADRRFSQGAPRPRPSLRITPALMGDDEADQQYAAMADPISDAAIAGEQPLDAGSGHGTG